MGEPHHLGRCGLAAGGPENVSLWAYGCIVKACACQQSFECMSYWVDQVIQEKGSQAAHALCARLVNHLTATIGYQVTDDKENLTTAEFNALPMQADGTLDNNATP